MNDDAFNMSIRKFLKTVGVHSQREIETAVKEAMDSGKLKGSESFDAKMVLRIEALGLEVPFDGRITLE